MWTESRNGNLFPMRLYCSCCFSTAHSLNTSNTTFFLALCLCNTRNSCVIWTKNGAMEGALCFMESVHVCSHVNVALYLYVFVKMRHHHTPGWRDYFHAITWTKWWKEEGERGESSSCRVAPSHGHDGLSTKVRCTMFLIIYQQIKSRTSAPLQRCVGWTVTV